MGDMSIKRASGAEAADSTPASSLLRKVGGGARFAKEFEGALNNLSGLDNSEKLREDAIRNAKSIIKNWKPPTDQQIDRILLKMRYELMA